MKLLIGILSALLLGLASRSNAEIIVDTTGGAFTDAGQGYLIDNIFGQVESLALPFNSKSSEIINSVDAYIVGGSGFLNIGLMADLNGVPSGNFLYSANLPFNLNNPVTLNGLNWKINSGQTYWLSVVSDVGGDGIWEFNKAIQGQFGYTSIDGPANVWFGSSGFVPKVEIEGNAVPEPATWSLLLAGFCIAGARLRIVRQARRTVLRLS